MYYMVWKVVEDIKQLLKGSTAWSVNFIHREGNSVARYLTKNGLLLTSEAIWLEDFLDVIFQYVLNDISSL